MTTHYIIYIAGYDRNKFPFDVEVDYDGRNMKDAIIYARALVTQWERDGWEIVSWEVFHATDS